MGVVKCHYDVIIRSMFVAMRILKTKGVLVKAILVLFLKCIMLKQNNIWLLR